MGIFGIFKPSPSNSSVKPVPSSPGEPLEDEFSFLPTETNASVRPETCSFRKLPVLTAPMGLDARDSSETSEDKQKAGIGRLLDLFRGVGTDLTRFQVPVHFNMPKSQLQLYGELVYCFSEDLLSKCAEAGSPIERFLAVVRWHISTTRPAPFGKAPYNPILGETHHVSVGDLHVLLEQVSHHPPISALYATNEKKGIQLSFWHQPSPRFYGSGVEIPISGRRSLKLTEHDEVYEMTCPKLCFRFLPIPGTDWSGNTTVYCPKTGLKATVTYKGKAFFGLHGSNRRITGKVWDTKASQQLYEIHGNWDQFVYLKDKSNGSSSTLFDAKAVLTDMATPEVDNLNAISPMESATVWSIVSESVLNRDIDKARAAKSSIEEEQRALRKERQASGNGWSPKFFTLSSEGDWEWQHHGQPVPRAPILVPSS